jgi:DNA-binding NarL/FixJ family response regulator
MLVFVPRPGNCSPSPVMTWSVRPRMEHPGCVVARDLSPDIVLLDMQLPDVTGFEVIRQIASEPDPPAIVLISSRDAADYGSRVARSGARGFITKAELSAPALAAVLGDAGC